MRFLHSIRSRIGTLALVSTIVWLIVTVYGEFLGGAPNLTCSPYLGCVYGFAGFDAVEHFLFGFAAVWIIVWICDAYARYSILHAEFWKSALIIVAIVALVAVFWEIDECLRDLYSVNILHEHLFDVRLHINSLTQPSNLDTMGDLTFTLVGSLFAFPTLRRWWKRRNAGVA